MKDYDQIDVTLAFHYSGEKSGKVHLRVMASREEDWSGWTESLDEALKLAMRRISLIQRAGWADKISERE